MSDSSIEHFGFEFRLPAKGIVIDQATLVRFPNGMLEFPRSLSDEDSVVFGPVHKDNDAKKLLGPELLQSKFKLMHTAMSVTPEQVKWWRFRSSQNKRAAILLFVKFVALTESSPLHSQSARPIYAISSGEFRGFQLGNPDVPPYDTRIDLFDGAENHLAFNI